MQFVIVAEMLHCAVALPWTEVLNAFAAVGAAADDGGGSDGGVDVAESHLIGLNVWFLGDVVMLNLSECYCEVNDVVAAAGVDCVNYCPKNSLIQNYD